MQQRTGALLVLASAVAFGVMPIFGKLAFEAGVGVATLLFVRFAIAAPVLWARRGAAASVPARRAAACCGRALALGARRLRDAGRPVLPRPAAHGRLRAVPDPLQLPRAGDGGGDPPRARVGQPAASRRPRHRVGRARARAGGRGRGQPSTSRARRSASARRSPTRPTSSSPTASPTTLDPLPLAALVTHRRGGHARRRRARPRGSLDLGFDAVGWLWLGARGARLDRRRGRPVLQRHEPRRRRRRRRSSRRSSRR